MIVVTKEGTSSLHGLDRGSSGGGDHKASSKKTSPGAGSGAAKSPNDAQGMVADDNDANNDDDLTSEEDNDSSSSSDDDDDDDDDVVEVNANGASTLSSARAGSPAARGSRAGGTKAGRRAVSVEQGKKGGPGRGHGSRKSGDGVAGAGVTRSRRGGAGKGNQRLFDWQVGERSARRSFVKRQLCSLFEKYKEPRRPIS